LPVKLDRGPVRAGTRESVRYAKPIIVHRGASSCKTCRLNPDRRTADCGILHNWSAATVLRSLEFTGLICGMYIKPVELDGAADIDLFLLHVELLFEHQLPLLSWPYNLW